MTARAALPALLRRLRLKPHPEGGYFSESYRSGGSLAVKGGKRSFSTAIYFLLARGDRSRLHRIKSDELWHFYAGGPVTVAQISPEGKVTRTTLGPDLGAGQKFQHAVPAGCWFGAYPAPGTAFALVGCTVAPGFDFADFELAGRDALIKKYPRARKLIQSLT